VHPASRAPPASERTRAVQRTAEGERAVQVAARRRGKQARFIGAVRENAAVVWEVRTDSPRGTLTGLCLPVGNAGAVRCRSLAQFSPHDRRSLLQAMRSRPDTERRILVRDDGGRFVKKCIGNRAVTGSHMRRSACEDL